MKRKILIGTVCYNLPSAIGPLLGSIQSEKYNTTVLAVQNGGFEEMTKAADAAIDANRDRGLILRHDWHSRNVGLARAWNDIQVAGFEGPDDYDAVIICNDDIVFGEGDIDAFADAAIAHASDETGIIACRANHVSYGPDWAIGYSCFAVTRGCWDRVACFDENLFPVYHEDQDHGYRCRLAGLHEFGIKANLTHGGSKHLLDDSALYVEAIRARNGITQPLNGEYFRRKWGGDSGKEGYTMPFNDPRFTYRIAPEDRHAPYPGYDREDYWVVTI